MLQLLSSLFLGATLVLAGTPLRDNAAFYGPAALVGSFKTIPFQNDMQGVRVQAAVGTPPQLLNLSLVMGAPYLYLDQLPCTGGDRSCFSNFNASASSTFSNITNATVPLMLGPGTDGVLARDVVRIGVANDSSDARLSTVALVEQPSSPGPSFIRLTDYSNLTQGLLGLGYGYSGSDVEFNKTTFGYASSTLNSTSFTIGVDVVANNRSELHWGSVNRAAGQNFTWMPIQQRDEGNFGVNGDWVTEIDAITFDGKSISLVNPNLTEPASNLSFVDLTYGSSISVPRFVAERIYGVKFRAGPDAQGNLDSRHAVPCDRQYNMTVTIGGREFHLDTRGLIYMPNPNNYTCYGTVVPDFGGVYRLGTPFLRSVYTALYARDPAIGSNDSSPLAALGFAQKPVWFARPSTAAVGTSSGEKTFERSSFFVFGAVLLLSYLL